MPSDTKDFRRALLLKVGLNSHDKTEARRILEEQILNEKTTDISKLNSYALKYNIPAEQRLHTWKLLLEQIPCIRPAQALVWAEQTEQAQILYRGLTIMRKTSQFNRPAGYQPPSAEDLLRMHLLQNASLEIEDDKQVAKACFGRFLTISERVIAICRLTLCDSIHFETLLAESYSIATGIDRLLRNHDQNQNTLLNELKCEIRLRNQSVYDLLEYENMWTDLPISKWFSSAFSPLLCPQALCLLWDKMLAGCNSVLVFVAIELFEYVHKCVKGRTLDSGVSKSDIVLTTLLHYASETPIVTQENLVKKAMEIWSMRGSCGLNKRK